MELEFLPNDIIPWDFNVQTAMSSPQAPVRTIYPQTFSEFLDSLEQWESELFSRWKLTLTTTITQVLMSIREEDIIIASDGSVKNGIGTYGWVIATKNGIKTVIPIVFSYSLMPVMIHLLADRPTERLSNL